MIGAVLTTFFFASTTIVSRQAITHFGSVKANFYRLIVATLILCLLANTVGHGHMGPGFFWFFLSGIVGMGIGDLGAYYALPRLGSRLTILIIQCLAVPIAAITEWMWIGTTIASNDIGWTCLILIGIVFALLPARKEVQIVKTEDRPRIPSFSSEVRWGLVCALIASVGQGLGAVLSRKAFDLTQGQPVDGFTSAYERMLGGLLLSGLFYLATKKNKVRLFRKESLFILLSAVLGPVLGVASYQWALSTTPSAIVLPIVATSPLVILPFSYFIEKEKPSIRSLLGGMVAVIGVIFLILF